MTAGSQDNLRAAGILTATMVLGVASDTILKFVFARLPVGEVAFLRGLVVCSALLLFLRLRGTTPKLRDSLQPAILARGCLELGAALSFFMALRALPLATAITLVFAAPLISIGLAAAVLRERVDAQRWGAALVGFAGVLLIVRPGPASFDTAAIWPLLTALLMSLRDLLTRTIPQRVDSGTIAFTSATIVALGGMATLPFAWVRPEAGELMLILAGGLLVAVTYQTLVIAFRIGDMSFLAPFRYVSIPLSALFGWIAFRDVPEWQVLAGAAVIVASGGYIFYRERRLAGATGAA